MILLHAFYKVYCFYLKWFSFLLQIKRENGGIKVIFNTAAEARAAKQLNGVVVGGRNLSISHIDDRKASDVNKVIINNVPTGEFKQSHTSVAQKVISFFWFRDISGRFAVLICR